MDTTLLFSGGLDSYVSAGLLLEGNQNRRLTCVFFDYGQHTADREWRAAQECIESLSGRQQERVVLMNRTLADYGEYVKDVSIVSGNVPKQEDDPRLFFVPGRNIVFLLYAAVLSYAHGCREIVFSSHKSDHVAGDCMPEFIESLQTTFQWGFSMQRKLEPYRIWSPLANLTKGEVVGVGTRLGLPIHLSWSCYDTGEQHCGVCHNCNDRKLAFHEAGIPDSTGYAH